jgi:adenosylcobinamide-GDP ribazoletransferase
VGALIGMTVGSVWWAAGRVWSSVAAAALAVVADVALTGYLHLDGLADSADGLLPPMGRERRLAVMADPAVGAFAVITVAVVVLLRFSALASMRAAPLAIAGLWCGSRTAMAVIPATVPYVRPGGLASPFLEGPVGGSPSTEGVRGASARAAVRPVGIALLGTALTVVLLLVGRGAHGIAAAGGELAGVIGVAELARRRIGGFTGDVLGAAGVVGETVGLLVLAARW